MPAKRTQAAAWVTRAQAARVFGVGVKRFDQRYRQGGVTERPGRGRSLEINITALVQSEIAKARGESNADELMEGPTDGPAIERYRQEKYLLARLDRLEREEILLRRSEVHQVYATLAQLLRGAGERLQREHGAEALAILDEALTEAAQTFQSAYPQETANAETDLDGGARSGE